MNLGVSFAPLVPSYVVWAGFAVAVAISLLLLIARSRGAPLRALALGLMVLALANPSLTREDRDPIPSVAAVIVDKSPSQMLMPNPSPRRIANGSKTLASQRASWLHLRPVIFLPISASSSLSNQKKLRNLAINLLFATGGILSVTKWLSNAVFL